MRSLFFSLLILLVSFIIPPNINEQIYQAIKEGNAQRIINYFDSRIYFKINTSEGFYSKEQAQILLEDFFKNNKPKDLKIIRTIKTAEAERLVLFLTTEKKESYLINYQLQNFNSLITYFAISKTATGVIY